MNEWNYTFKSMKQIFLISILIITSEIKSEIILNPVFDSDIYTMTGYPTQSTHTLGVSYGGIEHSQFSLIVFDTTNILEPANYASLNLYVLPIIPGSYASFGPGAIDIYEQGIQHQGYTTPWGYNYPLTIDDFIPGDYINTFDVTEEGIWINIDVTNTVNRWITNPNTNFGFSFFPLPDNALTPEVADPVGTQFAASEYNDFIPELEIILNEEIRLPSNHEINLRCNGHNSFVHNTISPELNIYYEFSVNLLDWENISTATNFSYSIELKGEDDLSETEISITFHNQNPENFYLRTLID